MTSLPESPAADPEALTALLERCKTLCESAGAAVESLAPKRTSFLARSLEDSLAQLELILRGLENASEAGEPQAQAGGLLRRLTRGRRPDSDEEEAGGNDVEAAEPQLSQQGLQGNSWTIPLPELLGFLAFGRKTGVLWVEGPDENFLIGMSEGNLIHASSDRTPEGLRLGEILVGFGYLTRRQLERFLTSDAEDGEGVSGEALLESGMISDDELRAALIHQVQQLFHRLIMTKNAVFHFREGLHVMLAYQVDLDITQLLLESARVHDEASISILAGAELAPEDWNSWNQEVLSELTKLVHDSEANLTAANEPEEAGADAKVEGEGSKTQEEPEAALPFPKARSEQGAADDEAKPAEADAASGGDADASGQND